MKMPIPRRSARRFLAAVWLLAVAALPVAADWPMFLGNAQRNSVVEGSFPPPLEVEWTYDAPDGIDSTAIIVGGTVYFGEMNGKFHAVDLATGKGKWVYQAGLGVPASGCVMDGAVFFGDEEGAFHAVDIVTGAQRWKHQTGAEILSSPNCMPGAVLVGSYDSSLYSFNPKTGQPNWSYRTEDRVHCSPAVQDGKTFVTGCDGILRVIDVKTVATHNIFFAVVEDVLIGDQCPALVYHARCYKRV